MDTPNHAIKYIQGRPYEVQQVIADDGSLVWIETGIHPDKVFGDKRTSKHPLFSSPRSPQLEVMEKMLTKLAQAHQSQKNHS